MTPGRLLYLLYHLPKAEVRRTAREGGPWQRWLDWRGRHVMETAAHRLPPLASGTGPPAELHQLTGRRHLAQSLFCLWSFSQVSGRSLAPTFYDDGTLSSDAAQKLCTVFPGARIVSHAESLARVQTLLPSRRFPALHERFHRYPLIRKLINIHLGSSGWKLLLDADLLFYRKPTFLLDWLVAPSRPLYLMDVMEAYGYSALRLRELAGAALPSRVNVGLCGMRSESIDWHKLEWWCSQLIRHEGRHYLLEQALTALLLVGQECAIAPRGDYITMPDQQEALAPTAVMHHYVDRSKRWYLRASWRNALGPVDTKCERGPEP